MSATRSDRASSSPASSLIATSSATAGQPATNRPIGSDAPTATFAATLAAVPATSAAHGSQPARVAARRSSLTIERHEEIDPQRLVFLIGYLVVKVGNEEWKAAIEVGRPLGHQRIGIPAWTERAALVARGGVTNFHVPFFKYSRTPS